MEQFDRFSTSLYNSVVIVRDLIWPVFLFRSYSGAEQKTGHIIQFRYCSDSRRSLRVLAQATEEPQRTSSFQKLMAH